MVVNPYYPQLPQLFKGCPPQLTTPSPTTTKDKGFVGFLLLRLHVDVVSMVLRYAAAEFDMNWGYFKKNAIERKIVEISMYCCIA